ncbi:MAG: YbjQ family protein [Candidatus Melainabacteria bacterium]|nr:YbjQ family protein [Candidatus Melainabacteria bacterium]
MELTNIESIRDKKIIEHYGLVMGATVRARNIVSDLMAMMVNMFGGEVIGYTELLKEARKEATERMLLQASELGANAIVNIRFSTASIKSGTAEILVYGTAVKVEEA